jgi:hypothetical protein
VRIFARGSGHTPAFAPCQVEGLTAKIRCGVTVAVAVGVAPLRPGAAAIVRQAIPPPQNQSPLRPAMNPQSCVLSPPPLPLPLPLCNSAPLAGK